MPKPCIFVTRATPPAGSARLSEDAELDIWDGKLPPPRTELLKRVVGVAGLYCLLTDLIDEEVLAAAGPGLRVVSQMAVGTDNIDVAACSRRRIPVGNTPGVLTEATADLAVALLLGTARRLIESAAAVRRGDWQTWEPLGFLGPDVYGSTVGVIGMGRIGRAVARRLSGFEVRLLYHNRRPSPEASELGAEYASFERLLSESDFVSLHCPLTPETYHLINARALRLMKPSAVLINTARGEVVDQGALYEVLRDGVIAAAGLDVTTPEPLPPDAPILSLPNAVVLPHIGSASIQARTRMALLAADNLIAGLRGERLPHCVNPEVYDT